MASVTLEHVSKVYPNGVKAVEDFNLAIADGEFMVLVGPSGCGKTTALRMVAGLEEISEGTLRVGDRVVNGLGPRERDIAMVFQNYALYPHMTVAENIGFALRIAKMPKAEIRTRVTEAAATLGLTELLDKKPGELSGGQRQRVAMGRALVREPSVFLMDEPLSNLDAKLRVQMRSEISRIQRRLNVATIYVTHDQTEAMTMGDRVAVMRSGSLQQVDTPQRLYDDPVNIFVAGFIGSPVMNFYEAVLSPEGDELSLARQRLEFPPQGSRAAAVEQFRGRDVIVGIRPENLHDAALLEHAAPRRTIEADVELVETLGSDRLVHFRLDAGRFHSSDRHGPGFGDLGLGELNTGELGASAMTAGVARIDPASAITTGERARFVVDVERLHLFDPETGLAIGHREVRYEVPA